MMESKWNILKRENDNYLVIKNGKDMISITNDGSNYNYCGGVGDKWISGTIPNKDIMIDEVINHIEKINKG